MKAWYFSNTDCKLSYDDKRLIQPGVTHKVSCQPILCEQGLHASVNILDALQYAPGPYIWRVELGGKIVQGSDKVVATERTYLWGYDATDILWEMGRLCALDVVHLWNAPKIVIQYLKSGDESLRAAARDAARAAARDASWYLARAAARAVARAAARDTARAATWDAARAVAWAVARDTERAATWDAARAVQSRRLVRLIMRGRVYESKN